MSVVRGILKFLARPPEFPPIFSTRFSPSLTRRFWAFMDRTERHTNYPNLFRAISLIHNLLMIFHWNGCVYHIVYKNNGFGSKNWVFSDSETADVVKQYLQSYYWCTLALTTIGDLPRYLFLPTIITYKINISRGFEKKFISQIISSNICQNYRSNKSACDVLFNVTFSLNLIPFYNTFYFILHIYIFTKYV